jgi:hypothetical protein
MQLFERIEEGHDYTITNQTTTVQTTIYETLPSNTMPTGGIQVPRKGKTFLLH